MKERLVFCFQLLFKFIRKINLRPRKDLPVFLKIGIWISYFILFVIISIFLVNINFLWLFGKMPKMSSINNPEIAIASELYSADGKLIGKFFKENRTPVKFDEISPVMIETLIATEDVRFYKHNGVDVRSTLGILSSLLKGEKRGASTITQQLVKNLFKTRSNFSKGLLGYIPGVRTFIYKLKEIITAFKLEFNLSKEEILTAYLNTVDFGSNSFGIKTAAKTFFNVKPSELNINQSALLVGVLKAPTLYNPRLNPKNALKRRNVVLGQLLKYDHITQAEFDSLTILPLELKYDVENNYDGEALYFREEVINELEPWLKENGYNIYEDGLRIYTTIDSRLQKYAEAAMEKNMKFMQVLFEQHWKGRNPWCYPSGEEIPCFIEKIARQTRHYTQLKAYYKNADSVEKYYLNLPVRMKVFTWNGEKDTTFSILDSIRYYNKLLHAGFYALEPGTGNIKAWVGGIDYRFFKYDHVRQSKRQPGSTFKSFLYTAAIDNGYSPCDYMTDMPVTINYVENGENKSWSPHNADGNFTGMSITLKYAYAKSINSVAVQVSQKIGFDKVPKYARLLGIKSKIAEVPSACLGSSDVSLFELVNAYCPMVNGGYKIEPVFVTKILDKKGKVIYEKKCSKTKVLDDETAFLMTQMLLGALTEPGGTTQELWAYDLFRPEYNTDFGGKTGTSSNQSDAWFIGISPTLVAGTWVGADDRSVHFRTTDMGEGCKTALPIYAFFWEKVLKDNNFKYLRGRFPKPSFKVKKNYMCHTYLPSDSSGTDSTQLIP